MDWYALSVNFNLISSNRIVDSAGSTNLSTVSLVAMNSANFALLPSKDLTCFSRVLAFNIIRVFRDGLGSGKGFGVGGSGPGVGFGTPGRGGGGGIWGITKLPKGFNELPAVTLELAVVVVEVVAVVSEDVF